MNVMIPNAVQMMTALLTNIVTMESARRDAMRTLIALKMEHVLFAKLITNVVSLNVVLMMIAPMLSVLYVRMI